MQKFLVYYYILINLICFVLIYIDKKRAIKNLWRIKEKTLFIFYLLGGFLGGGLSMFLFHHKTKKIKFYIVILISIILNIIINYLFLETFKNY